MCFRHIDRVVDGFPANMGTFVNPVLSRIRMAVNSLCVDAVYRFAEMLFRVSHPLQAVTRVISNLFIPIFPHFPFSPDHAPREMTNGGQIERAICTARLFYAC